MKLENRTKAARILAALDQSTAPISWHCMDEDELIDTIVRELIRIEKEEADSAERKPGE